LRPRKFKSARWPLIVLTAMFALGGAVCVTLVQQELGPPEPTPLQVFGVQPAPGEDDPFFGGTAPPAKRDPLELAKVVFATAFCGLGVLIGVAAFFRPLTVTLDDKGFIIQPPIGRMTSVRWIDLECVIFLEGSVMSKRAPSVAWRYRNPVLAQTALAQFNRSVWGIDASITGRFTLPTRELVNLMESYRMEAQNKVRRFHKYEQGLSR
jgi:hypothetical protein